MPAEATPSPINMESPETEASSELRTILVVDDDADIRVSISELLQDEGYRVIAAEDGQKAFDYLAASPPPACVVLDLWMPVKDGWSLAADVLDGRLPQVPILIVTASNANFGYPVAARYVLRKPFDMDRLLTLVAELIAQNQRAAEK